MNLCAISVVVTMIARIVRFYRKEWSARVVYNIKRVLVFIYSEGDANLQQGTHIKLLGVFISQNLSLSEH